MDYLREMEKLSVPQEPMDKIHIEDRLGTLVQRLEPQGASAPGAAAKADADVDFGARAAALAKGAQGAEPLKGLELQSAGLAAELCELIGVATKIVQLDLLASKASGVAPPEGTEAKIWQEISMNAMQCSRAALLEQQKRCAERLGSVSAGLAGGNNAAGPAPAPPLIATSLPPAAPAATPQKQQKEPAPPAQQAPTPAAAAAAAAAAPPPQAGDGPEWTETLRTHLALLQKEDCESILIVRRINRLGFQSSTFMEEYFAKFGPVRNVLVAHSRVKPSPKRQVARVRPAGVGFVVMENASDVEGVLAASEHCINGVQIQVQRYEARSMNPEDRGDQEENFDSM